MPVAAETHEQGVLVEQRDAARERMDFEPDLERPLNRQGDWDLALAAALAAHEQPVVPRVRPGTSEIPGAQAAQLGGAQPAVAQHPQQRVVALASQGAAVGDAQQVRVVAVGQRLRRPGLVTRHPHTVDLVLAPEIAGERPVIETYTREVAGAAGRPPRPPALARCRAKAAITSVSRSPTSGGRPSSPASQSPNAPKIAAYCRRVPADAARAAIRCASPNRLLFQPGRRRRRRRDRRGVGELVGDRAVDELKLHRRLGGGEQELLGLPHALVRLPIRETSHLGSR